MYREIKTKQTILDNRKPYSSETNAYIQEMNLLDWIQSSMRLDGSTLGRAEIRMILNGEYIRDASLTDHVLVERYKELIKSANDMLAMSYTLNKEMILGFHQKLMGDGASRYRTMNPVLVSLNHNPPHPSEIQEQMELLMNWFYSDDMEKTPLMKAVCLHLRLIEIYPFDKYSEAIARSSMYYYLMEKGLCPFEIKMTDQEYNIAVIQYLQREDIEPFYMEAEKSLLNKMEVLVQLTMGG
jgi:Fic family protein